MRKAITFNVVGCANRTCKGGPQSYFGKHGGRFSVLLFALNGERKPGAFSLAHSSNFVTLSISTRRVRCMFDWLKTNTKSYKWIYVNRLCRRFLPCRFDFGSLLPFCFCNLSGDTIVWLSMPMSICLLGCSGKGGRMNNLAIYNIIIDSMNIQSRNKKMRVHISSSLNISKYVR